MFNIPSYRISEAVAYVHARVSDTHARHGGREVHVRTRLDIVRVAYWTGEVFVQDLGGDNIILYSLVICI